MLDERASRESGGNGRKRADEAARESEPASETDSARSRARPLEARLRRRLARWGVTPDTPLAVGVSGGGDSLALLAALAEIHPRLTALHVEHGLRPDSAADAEFTRLTCGTLEVPCAVLPVRLAPGGNLEARARAARRRALAEACEARGVTRLLLAHTRDDAAETLLINLARGAGGRGLGALRARRRRGALELLRPLLGESRHALREYLSARGLAWREDVSNLDGNLRARIRHRLLPLLAELGGRDPIPLLARAARLLARDEVHFARQVAALSPARESLPIATLRGLSPALRDRLLRAWFARVRPGARGLARMHLRAAARLLAADGAGGEAPWPGDWRLVRERGALSLRKRERPD